MGLPKYKLLEKHYGGKWTYRGFAGWTSDDGRFVCPTSNGMDEWDNPISGPYRYYLYGHKICEEVKWWKLMEDNIDG